MQIKCERFLCDEQGVTSIEYALIGSLIAMVIIIAVQAVGIQLCAVFSSVVTGFGAAAPGC